MVLSNQARQNLSAVSKSFEGEVFENTSTKIIFRVESEEDARFWSAKSGTTSYTDHNMRLYSGSTYGGDTTALDGMIEREGTLTTRSKNLIHANVFLNMPKGMAVIFRGAKLASLASLEYMMGLDERNALLQRPFEPSTDYPFFRQHPVQVDQPASKDKANVPEVDSVSAKPDDLPQKPEFDSKYRRVRPEEIAQPKIKEARYE